MALRLLPKLYITNTNKCMWHMRSTRALSLFIHYLHTTLGKCWRKCTIPEIIHISSFLFALSDISFSGCYLCISFVKVSR